MVGLEVEAMAVFVLFAVRWLGPMELGEEAAQADSLKAEHLEGAVSLLYD